MLIFVFLFILGTLIGSFLNVVILRFNTGKPILSLSFGGKVSRSECFSCGKMLHWWELVPLVSFLVLRGKCSACKAKISWQYPMVEFLTGAVLAAIYFKVAGTGLDFAAPDGFVSEIFWPIIFYFLVWCALIVIFFYDLKHKIIPDFFVFSFILFAAVFNVMSNVVQTGSFASAPLLFSSLDFWAGPIFFAVFAGLWLVSHGRWLGFGDAKLVLGIGLLLGWRSGLSALVLAFWVGALLGVALIAWSKQLTMKSEIPFAPFLILGTAIAFFGGVVVF